MLPSTRSVSAPIPPRSVEAAFSSDDGPMWQAALDKELTKMLTKQVWSACVLPAGKQALRASWTFTRPINNWGHYDFRARLVVRNGGGHDSYTSEPDWTEHLPNFRLMLSVAASEGMKLGHVSVEDLCLDFELQDEVYIKIPHGVKVLKGRNALRLRTTLHGLVGCNIAHKIVLDKALNQVRFFCSSLDPTLYFRVGTFGDTEAIALLYSGGIFLISHNAGLQRQLVDILHKGRHTASMARTDKLFGIDVKRTHNGRGFYLEQRQFVNQLIEDFPYVDTDYDQLLNKRELFRSLASRIDWLARSTRPEMTHPAFMLSRQASGQALTKLAWDDIACITQRLKSRSDMGICIYPHQSLNESSYLNALTLGDEHQSTDGAWLFREVYNSFLYCPIMWYQVRDRDSTTVDEAAFMAIVDAADRLKYWRDLLTELGINYGSGPSLVATNRADLIEPESVTIDYELRRKRKHEDGYFRLCELIMVDEIKVGADDPDERSHETCPSCNNACAA